MVLFLNFLLKTREKESSDWVEREMGGENQKGVARALNIEMCLNLSTSFFQILRPYNHHDWCILKRLIYNIVCLIEFILIFQCISKNRLLRRVLELLFCIYAKNRNLYIIIVQKCTFQTLDVKLVSDVGDSLCWRQLWDVAPTS